MPPAYRIRNLIKIYPGRRESANSGIDLEVAQGEIFGILGSNGAGKSTLVRQMVSLLRPTSGTIELLGRDTQHDTLQVPLHVGYLPQDGRALVNLTVSEAIYATAHLRGFSRNDARADRDTLLDMWEIGDIGDKTGRVLSGGFRRLMQLAVAMAGSPPVLVLDEPTNELDPQRRKQVWRNLREYSETRGTTVIFITHDALEAEKALQRVGIMRAGRFEVIGKPADLKRTQFNQLRLEISFAPDQPPVLPDNLKHIELEPGRWLVVVPRDRVDELLRSITLANMVDFKLYSATLEDLFLQIAEQTPESA